MSKDTAQYEEENQNEFHKLHFVPFVINKNNIQK